MIKSLLLCVDGSAYTESVLRHGAHLATAFDAHARLLSVVDIRIFEWTSAMGADAFVPVIPSTAYQEESRRLMEEKAEAVLKKCAEVLEEAGVSFETERLSGPPADIIVERAHLVDLLVMGVRGEFATWESKMVGATLHAVSRETEKPIFVARREVIPTERILVGYDGSAPGSRAMQLAAFFASRLSVPLTVLSVSPNRNVGDRYAEEARKYLSHYDIEFDTDVIPGTPERKIASYAEEKGFSLIVIGRYGHSRIREALLGSTAENILRRSTVPAVMVK